MFGYFTTLCMKGLSVVWDAEFCRGNRKEVTCKGEFKHECLDTSLYLLTSFWSLKFFMRFLMKLKILFVRSISYKVLLPNFLNSVFILEWKGEIERPDYL